jgi:hypothetical protein
VSSRNWHSRRSRKREPTNEPACWIDLLL